MERVWSKGSEESVKSVSLGRLLAWSVMERSDGRSGNEEWKERKTIERDGNEMWKRFGDGKKSNGRIA